MNFRKDALRLSLDGAWSLAYSMEGALGDPRTVKELEGKGLQVLRAKVPGNFELDLQANGVVPEPFFGMNIASLTKYERAHCWYWRRLSAEIPEGHDALLVFEGLDCDADVFLNGELLVGVGGNMLVPQVVDVTNEDLSGAELLVHIRPAVEAAEAYDYPSSAGASMPTTYEGMYVRKAPHMYGWDIMPRAVSAGIWRPVSIVFLPKVRLDNVYLDTQWISEDHSVARLSLAWDGCFAAPGKQDVYEILVRGRCGESTFEHRERALFKAGRARFSVERPKLWWPRDRGEQALYDVRVTLFKNGEEVDHLCLTHGIRTVELERTSVTDMKGSGEFCFKVNGERFFAKGSNWVPLDAYHSRDIERVERALELVDEAGCNMLRCWGGNVYESDLFYEICDRKGVMIWQDFSMACARYPQDPVFCARIEREVRQVVRRLRQHPCIALWAGDNECDQAYGWGGRDINPNKNKLTRQVIPDVLAMEDESRPYLPSSPYIDETAFQYGVDYISEQHLWGPRDYYKSRFYTESVCHFASEMGYHGCPSPESLREFLSPDKVWPYEDNEEWILHCTSPVPGVDLCDYRVELMAKQIRELFGVVPDNLDDFAFASQASQAEAKKFFVELFRTAKWRRTGVLWWNILDGWPQLSDAVVDYYFRKKLAFDFIKRAQQPVIVALREPANWGQEVVACNDLREDLSLEYRVWDVDTEETICASNGTAFGDAVTVLGRVPFSMGEKRFYGISWRSERGEGGSHYLCGNPPFELGTYRAWLLKAKLE